MKKRRAPWSDARRQFTQDDATSLYAGAAHGKSGNRRFCRLRDGIFGFTYEVELSTRPEESIGSDATGTATTALEGRSGTTHGL